MADLAFVAVMVAFFALAAIFVAACERIVGTDASYKQEPAEVEAPVQEAAA